MHGGDGAYTGDVLGGARRPNPAARSSNAKSHAKSHRKWTPEQDARRRQRHLERRSSRHEQCRASLRKQEKAARSLKDEAQKVVALKKLAVSARQCARFSREQSRRRAFLERRSGYERTPSIRTSSGYTIRADYPKDLKVVKGHVMVNFIRPKHLKFEAWREAVQEVGGRAHPSGTGALLAKKDGDDFEKAYYGEIKAEYDEILKTEWARLARDVDRYNERVAAQNADLRDRCEKLSAEDEKKASAARKAARAASSSARLGAISAGAGHVQPSALKSRQNGAGKTRANARAPSAHKSNKHRKVGRGAAAAAYSHVKTTPPSPPNKQSPPKQSPPKARADASFVDELCAVLAEVRDKTNILAQTDKTPYKPNEWDKKFKGWTIMRVIGDYIGYAIRACTSDDRGTTVRKWHDMQGETPEDPINVARRRLLWLAWLSAKLAEGRDANSVADFRKRLSSIGYKALRGISNHVEFAKLELAMVDWGLSLVDQAASAPPGGK